MVNPRDAQLRDIITSDLLERGVARVPGLSSGDAPITGRRFATRARGGQGEKRESSQDSAGEAHVVPPDRATQLTVGSELQRHADGERADCGAGEHLVARRKAAVA